MNTTTLRQREFTNGWIVKLCADPAGYVIRMAQHGAEMATHVRPALVDAERYYASVCRIMQQSADRALASAVAKYNIR